MAALLSGTRPRSKPTLCLIQGDAGTNTSLGKAVPVCLGYLNIHGAKQGKKGFLALQRRRVVEADCWAPASAAVNTKRIRTWGWLGPGPSASPRALLGHAGQYTLLAGESSGLYLLVGGEVLNSLGEFPTNWAINSSSCSLEQLRIYPFFCFGFCGRAQTTGF